MKTVTQPTTIKPPPAAAGTLPRGKVIAFPGQADRCARRKRGTALADPKVVRERYIALRDRYRTKFLLATVFLAGALLAAMRPVPETPADTIPVELEETQQSSGPTNAELASVFARFASQVSVEPPRPKAVVVTEQGSLAHEAAHRVDNHRPSRATTVAHVHRIIKRYAPRHQNAYGLAQAIVSEAERQEYDPLFVAAVIKSESAFNALARSHKGAQGLMQIMPATGRWLAEQASMPRGSLTDTGHNLELGIRYLKQLEAQYGGDRVFTLIAYNWGPGHVESAADGKRRVPSEVVTYAIKILNDYRRWRTVG